MLISVIIPTQNEEQQPASIVGSLSGQTVEAEVILVTERGQPEGSLGSLETQIRIASSPAATLEEQFNAGAAMARGEVLLFLGPGYQLPVEALPAIDRNFQLLPQSVGGNFHVRFERNFLFARLLAYIIKWWRYKGSYGSDSGIFVRADVFEKIGGFQPDHSFADFYFACRMEAYGPTLYLHEAIIAPKPNLRQVLTWFVAPIMAKRET